MIKKLFLILFVIILSGKTASAQIPQNKWWIVQDLPDKIVYIDTSAVKLTENQISVWSLVVYRSPIKLNAFREEIARIKSQYLFNIANKKYAVIGTLYYDNRSRIVGESISPVITGSGDRFTLDIQPGSPVEKVFEKAQEFLNFGSLQSEPSELAAADNQNNLESVPENIPDTINNEETNFNTEPEYKLPDDPLLLETFENAVPKKPGVDSSLTVTDEDKKDQAPVDPKIFTGPSAKDIKKDIPIDNSGVEAQESDSVEGKVYDPVSGKYITLGGAASIVKTPETKPEVKYEEVAKREIPKVSMPAKSITYNPDTDKNVKGNIWSDGNFFTVQASSWRTKSVADNEVSKLKAKGHDAFIFETYLPSKKATYHRVRIGNFNTLKEAEEYQKKLK